MAKRMGKGKQGKTLFLCSTKSQKNQLLSRKPYSVKICRSRLGHCGLNSYLHIIGKHSSGLCECGSPETVKHILMECSKYSVERRELFKTASDLGLNSFSVKSLFSLHDNHQQIMAAILQFLRNTGLYARI